jgi:HAD superfamily hydrolase (TIGR01509 family)
MRTFKGLIFDFNGVLLWDQHLHDAVWKKYAGGITGREIDDEELKTLFHGRTNRSALEHLFGRDLEKHEVDEHTTKKELAYQELSRTLGSDYCLSEGAVGLLENLKREGVPFTIATSSPKMNVDFFNEMLGLDKYFDMEKVVYDDGIIRGKPAPDLYLKAAQVLELDPKDCVVIEDARSGIASAHAAGVGHIIAIGPKSTHESLRSLAGVDETVEKLSEVDVKALFG